MEKHHFGLAFLTLPYIRKSIVMIREPFENHDSSLFPSPLKSHVRVRAQQPGSGLVRAGPTSDKEVCDFSPRRVSLASEGQR